MDIISYQIGKNSAPQPSGSLSITENGTYDVTEKASAVVNVQGGGAGLPINITSNCPSPFLLNQNNITSNVKYIFPTTTASIVPTSVPTTPYIQSSGSQYIDTGFVHSANTKIELDCEILQTSAQQYEPLFGARNQNFIYNAFVFFNRFEGNWIPVYNRSGAETQGSNFIYNKRITLTCEGNIATWTDGTYTYSLTTTGTVNNGVCTIGLLTINSATSTSSFVPYNYFSTAKLYRVKIWDNDTLVRDFVPAQSQESGHENEACLYDNVTETYFYNQGTGTFTWGEATTPVTEIDVGDEVEINLSPVNAYATFSYQWQKLQNDEYVNISGATSSTYTAQTGDNAIRCILTGTGNSEGTITSSSITVNEVD